jgi:hypothetical protein
MPKQFWIQFGGRLAKIWGSNFLGPMVWDEIETEWYTFENTVSIGSVLKWRARSIELNWQSELGRYFKAEPTDIVAFCLEIS